MHCVGLLPVNAHSVCKWTSWSVPFLSGKKQQAFRCSSDACNELDFMLLFTGRGVALCLGTVTSMVALHRQTVENSVG